MELQATPLLLLPQSKIVKNTASFLQSKLTKRNVAEIGYAPNLVSFPTQSKFYKSQNQYFPTDNNTLLESEASCWIF